MCSPASLEMCVSVLKMCSSVLEMCSPAALASLMKILERCLVCVGVCVCGQGRGGVVLPLLYPYSNYAWERERENVCVCVTVRGRMYVLAGEGWSFVAIFFLLFFFSKGLGRRCCYSYTRAERERDTRRERHTRTHKYVNIDMYVHIYYLHPCAHIVHICVSDIFMCIRMHAYVRTSTCTQVKRLVSQLD